MSVNLLLGITAVGVGWIALGRGRADAAAGAALSVDDAKLAADVGEPQNNLSGAASVAAAADGSVKGDSTYGGDPIAGVDNCNKAQVASVNYAGPSGEPGIVSSTADSLGGADPSTLRSGVGVAKPDSYDRETGGNGWSSARNPEEQLYAAAYGPAGAAGVTSVQASAKYAELGRFTGEVW